MRDPPKNLIFGLELLFRIPTLPCLEIVTATSAFPMRGVLGTVESAFINDRVAAEYMSHYVSIT